MKYVVFTILALLAAFVAVIVIRTLNFKPRSIVKTSDEKVDFDREGAVQALQTLIRFKTVSYREREMEDDRQFEDFVRALPSLYPNVFKVCALNAFPDRALLFKWAGRSSAAPSVLMAHYDVVPADESAWEKPAFEGIIEGGVLWGRGTLDTKVTFNGVLYAANHLIGEGYVPENDIYFAFSGGEEINGMGAVHIVDWFEKEGITPAMVVDEGGAVVENVFPGVRGACGLIGIAEKGLMDVRFVAKSNGGHASAPKPHTPVGVLARACCKVENNPFKSHLSVPVKAMFDTLGRHSTFVYRMIFANLWLFSPVLDMICKTSGGELNALMRTTVAFTQMQGSSASNVIPPRAEMVANMRLNPHDNMDSALACLKDTVSDKDVEVEILHGIDPSRISNVDCDGWNRVASAVASTWRGTIVSPYLMVQCSDSRHWGRISDRVYRFSAMDLTSEERATIHGHNERIRLEALYRTVEFYIRLMKMS